MYLLIENIFFRFIKFEDNFIICSNDMNIYKIPFTTEIKFFSIKNDINYDLLDLILQNLSPKVEDQINFTTLDSSNFNRLIIKKLDASSNIDDQILQSINCSTPDYLWTGLIALNANYNNKITDVSFMAASLRILDAAGNCGIDQAGIQGLQLVKLNTSDNEKIKDVRFMAATLCILDAAWYCGIDQAGIQGLQLVELDAKNNEKITDVRFMTATLRILKAAGRDCGIDQAGIQGLQLVELNAYDNNKIKHVNFMAATLRILDAAGFCGIDQAGIQGLQLVKLNADDNKKITTKSFDHRIK